MKRTPVEPVLVAHLFPEIRAELLRILESLTDEEWALPTACEGWSVRDVALHLFADDVQLLSGMRDHDGNYQRIDDWQDLVTFINAQNDLWIQGTRRISRRLLVSLLQFTGGVCHEFLASLDPFMLSGSVGWTGNDADPLWLHSARAITEYWMHHQHICDAISRTSLREARYVYPILSTFAYALPQVYRNADAPDTTVIKLVVTGEGGAVWNVVLEAGEWKLYSDTDFPPASTVMMDVAAAWRMFTKGIGQDELRQQMKIEGNAALGERMLQAVAIIA